MNSLITITERGKALVEVVMEDTDPETAYRKAENWIKESISPVYPIGHLEIEIAETTFPISLLRSFEIPEEFPLPKKLFGNLL